MIEHEHHTLTVRSEPCAGVGPGDRNSSHHADPDTRVRAIVAGQVTAWNSGDGIAYARHAAPNISFTNLFGMVMYGAPAFAQRHAEILATSDRGTTKHHAIRRIRFVTPDVAIGDIDNEVRGVTAMPAGIRSTSSARGALTPEMRDGDTFNQATTAPDGASQLERLVAFSDCSL